MSDRRSRQPYAATASTGSAPARSPPRTGQLGLFSASSRGARFRPSGATCDVSTERFRDHRSTDERGPEQFPLPTPDAVVPVPQDALPWTCRSPEFRWRGAAPARARSRATRAASVPLLMQSRVCLATGKPYGGNFRGVLRSRHSARRRRVATFFDLTTAAAPSRTSYYAAPQTQGLVAHSVSPSNRRTAYPVAGRGHTGSTLSAPLVNPSTDCAQIRHLVTAITKSLI